MTIWVDADACPNVIKDILFRAAERARVAVVLVANSWLRTPPSRYISALQVPGGLDVADGEMPGQLGEALGVLDGAVQPQRVGRGGPHGGVFIGEQQAVSANVNFLAAEGRG